MTFPWTTTPTRRTTWRPLTYKRPKRAMHPRLKQLLVIGGLWLAFFLLMVFGNTLGWTR
jgi:hypothetical protein